MSLLCLGPVPTAQHDPTAARQRAAIVVAVALLQLVFALGLREAMRPVLARRSVALVPMQITIIERHPARIAPQPIVMPQRVLPKASSPPPTVATRPVPDRSVPLPSAQPPHAATAPKDALQAVAIEPPPVPVVPIWSPALLFDKNGVVRVPSAQTQEHPRDLLAHRDVSYMLPGAAHSNSPDFHVRDDPSPEDVVNSVVGFIVGNGPAPRPDAHGLVQVASDRGMRMSGRGSNPCEDITQSLVDPDAQAREEATERYERSCEEH